MSQCDGRGQSQLVMSKDRTSLRSCLRSCLYYVMQHSAVVYLFHTFFRVEDAILKTGGSVHRGDRSGGGFSATVKG